MNDWYQQEIDFWQLQFRVLADWQIIAREDGDYECEVTVNEEAKTASIVPCGCWDDQDGPPDNYIFHEILHICCRTIRMGEYPERRENEELLVQDLCKIYAELEK